MPEEKTKDINMPGGIISIKKIKMNIVSAQGKAEGF